MMVGSIFYQDGFLVGKIKSEGQLLGSISSSEHQLVGHMVFGSGCEEYTGEYTITPSNEQQILFTENKRMANNVVVNKIPSNYGLITYNGFEIMVS